MAMTVMAKMGIAAVIGCAAGVGITYVVLTRRYTNQNKKDIEEIRNYYQARLYKKQPEEDGSADPGVKIKRGQKSDSPADLMRKFDALQPNRKKLDYTSYYHRPGQNGDNELNEDNKYALGEELSEEIQSNQNKEPYIIDKDDWESEEGKYEKVELLYYTDDDVLTYAECDNVVEEDIVIHDQNRLLGTCLEDSSFSWDSTEYFRVRNPKLGTDYEILKVTGPYHDPD